MKQKITDKKNKDSSVQSKSSKDKFHHEDEFKAMNTKSFHNNFAQLIGHYKETEVERRPKG